MQPQPSIKRTRFRLVTLLLIPILLYAAICLCMWAMQRQLMYVPYRDVQRPGFYGLEGVEDIRLQSADGTKVQAWYAAAKPNYPVLLFFHGNGGHLGYRAHYFGMLREKGFGLLALSYRGYGVSEGRPSEQGFYQDARAMMHYASDVLKLPPEKIVLYGESIGTGVAVQMATEFPVALVALQSPYSSITEVASSIYPWLPVRWLLKDRFDSISKIKNVHAPLLVMHGELDTVVPLRFGRALYEAADEPKAAVYFKEHGHNDTDPARLAAALVDFCRG